MEVTVSPQGLPLIDRKSKLDMGSQEHENSDSSRNGGWHCCEVVPWKPRATLKEAAGWMLCAHIFLLEIPQVDRAFQCGRCYLLYLGQTLRSWDV